MKKASNYTPADLVKFAIGAAPGLSSPAAWKPAPQTGSAAANTGSAGNFGTGLGKSLAPVGKQVFNKAIQPLATTGWNTLQGIGTTAIGAANAGAGGIGNVISAAGYGVGAATDAAGLTNNAKGWVANNMWRHTNNAARAGAMDFAGGVADTLSGGRYDYDGTFAGPGHAGTAVEQFRSGVRDQLGRGSGYDTAFNFANNVSDLAASQAGFGGTGRAINVGAQALRNSQLAAPVLNAAAQTPVVGAPAAAAGRWLAGPAPAANMFRQSLPEYYRTSLRTGQPGGLFAGLGMRLGPRLATAGGMVDDAARIAFGASDEISNTRDAIAETINPADRPADARAYQMQQAQTLANARETYGGALAPAVARGVDEHFNARISNLTAKNAPPEEINRAYDEYLQHVGKNMQVPEYEQLRHTVDQARPGPPAPQQAAGTPHTDAMTYADPAARGDLYARALTPLTEAKTPEQKAEVEKTLVPQLAEQVKNTTPPEKVQAVQAVAQDPNSPEARKAIEEGRNTFATEQAGGDQTKLQDPEFFGSVMGMWNGLGAPGQMAFMLGVPMALIGLLSGDGLTGLLGGLGIGGLGIAGAAGGMFGNQAQAATGKMLGDMGNFFGMIPDEARDAKNLMPGSDASKKFETEVAKAFKAQGPEAAQKLIDARTAQFQPLEQMHKLNPQFAHSFLMGMQNGPQSPEEAQKLYEQLNAQVAQARDPNFLRNKATDMATQQVQRAQNMVPEWMRVAARLGKDNIPGAKTVLPTSIQDLIDNASTDPRVIAQREVAKRYAAQPQQRETRASVREFVQKAARCWAGYAPVPGKAPYSENSCRPKRKAKKKKAEKTAEQQYSEQPFNPAIGYKHPNPKASPLDVYKNQMYRSGLEMTQKAKNPKYQFSSTYNTAMQHYGHLPPKPPVVPPAPAVPQAVGQFAQHKNPAQQQAISNK